MSAYASRDDVAQRGTMEFPLRESARSRAEAYLAGELGEPAKPKLAATVMILRDTHREGQRAELEVFMMRRVSTMMFVPDAVVFPGGGVDTLDTLDPVLWAGREASAWAQTMDCDEETARAVITAAVREVFEECGVLLAACPSDCAAFDTQGRPFAEERTAIAARDISFAEFLRSSGLVLNSDLLSLRAHWITPPFEPRRYDTYFFVARLPQGQVADGHTSEAQATGWFTPRDILERFEKKDVLLVPPTIANLGALSRARSIDEVFAMPPEAPVMLMPARSENGDFVLRSGLS